MPDIEIVFDSDFKKVVYDSINSIRELKDSYTVDLYEDDNTVTSFMSIDSFFSGIIIKIALSAIDKIVKNISGKTLDESLKTLVENTFSKVKNRKSLSREISFKFAVSINEKDSIELLFKDEKVDVSSQIKEFLKSLNDNRIINNIDYVSKILEIEKGTIKSSSVPSTLKCMIDSRGIDILNYEG